MSNGSALTVSVPVDGYAPHQALGSQEAPGSEVVHHEAVEDPARTHAQVFERRQRRHGADAAYGARRSVDRDDAVLVVRVPHREIQHAAHPLDETVGRVDEVGQQQLVDAGRRPRIRPTRNVRATWLTKRRAKTKACPSLVVETGVTKSTPVSSARGTSWLADASKCSSRGGVLTSVRCTPNMVPFGVRARPSIPNDAVATVLAPVDRDRSARSRAARCHTRTHHSPESARSCRQ